MNWIDGRVACDYFLNSWSGPRRHFLDMKICKKIRLISLQNLNNTRIFEYGGVAYCCLVLLDCWLSLSLSPPFHVIFLKTSEEGRLWSFFLQIIWAQFSKVSWKLCVSFFQFGSSSFSTSACLVAWMIGSTPSMLFSLSALPSSLVPLKVSLWIFLNFVVLLFVCFSSFYCHFVVMIVLVDLHLQVCSWARLPLWF